MAKQACRIGKVTDEENVSDLFTKILGIPKRDRCLEQLVWRERHSIRDCDQTKDVTLNRQSMDRQQE